MENLKPSYMCGKYICRSPLSYVYNSAEIDDSPPFSISLNWSMANVCEEKLLVDGTVLDYYYSYLLLSVFVLLLIYVMVSGKPAAAKSRKGKDPTPNINNPKILKP